jgi:two-component system, chemotaxis family, response regulator Rcp1
MQNLTLEPLDVLVVEDNPGDARLIKEVLNSNHVYCRLHIVIDGVDAMNFLYKKGQFGCAPRPDLILLDLNLPKKDGREVLAEIKSNDRLKQIPVVIMTTSHADEDIYNSYSLHANCYIAKPMDLDQFVKVIKFIEEFWFSMVKLPKKE